MPMVTVTLDGSVTAIGQNMDEATGPLGATTSITNPMHLIRELESSDED